MAVASWNVRGLNNEEAMRNVKMFTKYHKPDLLFLMETRLTNGKFNTICNRLGFDHGFEIVATSWVSTYQSALDSTINNIKKCSTNLSIWNQSMFGTMVRDIKETHQKIIRLHDIQDQLRDTGELRAMEHKLNELLYKEEIFWKQRYRILWLKAGDQNTKFFHQRANKRNKINTIKCMNSNTYLFFS